MRSLFAEGVSMNACFSRFANLLLLAIAAAAVEQMLQ
jgi:hypothetical protein